MSPGDLLWYESASVIHGRQWPLNGRSYDNLFVHFKPRGIHSWYRSVIDIFWSIRRYQFINVCSDEIHKSESLPSPISLELIQQEQGKMAEVDTDWDKFDYQSVAQAR